ncbi:hypothetical protein JCM15765_02350 [Paradesulfitobacterium aromaticivorans]
MTKLEVLQKYYDWACHNFLCYSKNYLLTEPKKGFETEWKQANEECELLKQMIDDYNGFVPRTVFKDYLEAFNQKVEEHLEQFQRD